MVMTSSRLNQSPGSAPILTDIDLTNAGLKSPTVDTNVPSSPGRTFQLYPSHDRTVRHRPSHMPLLHNLNR